MDLPPESRDMKVCFNSVQTRAVSQCVLFKNGVGYMRGSEFTVTGAIQTWGGVPLGKRL